MKSISTVLATLGLAAASLVLGCESNVIVQGCEDGECGGSGGSGPGPSSSSGPQPCPTGTKACGAVCVDVENDEKNCGACGFVCEPGASCVNGFCTGGSCPPGLQECNGICVDIFSDPSHCGGCNQPCGPGGQCFDGQCFGFCEPPFVDCGGFCVDPLVDHQHCGGCFSPCDDDETCQMGFCTGGACPGSVCGICDVVTLPNAVPFSVVGTTSGAQHHFTPSCVPVSVPEVAHEFTAPETGLYVFDTVGSTYDTILSVLGPGGCFETGCNDDTFGLDARVEVFLAAGETATIVVDGFTTGTYQLNANLDGGCTGPCGTCNSPVFLSSSVPQTVTGSTTGAPDDLIPSCTGQLGPEVLHQFTAPFDGSFIFSTQSSGYDTVLSVIDAASCGELACNDDFGGFTTSRITMDLAAGQTVYVVVDGKNASGFYSLFINGTPIVVCPTADLGSAVPLTVSGTTSGAQNLFVPACTPGSTAPDHSFTFTADQTKTYQMTTVGSSYDTVLHVLGATCSGVSLACDDDTFGLQSQVFVPLTQGQTVTVVVDGFGSQSGSYVLNIE